MNLRRSRSSAGSTASTVVVTVLVVAFAAGAGLFFVRERYAVRVNSVFTVDYANRTYGGCRDEPVRLVDGRWNDTAASENDIPDHVYLSSVQFGDVTGDGKSEAVVSLDCIAGASNAAQWNVVYRYDSDKVVEIGSFPGYGAFIYDDRSGVGNSMRVSYPVLLDTDPDPASPSTTDTVTYTFNGTKLVETARASEGLRHRYISGAPFRREEQALEEGRAARD